VGLSLSTGNPRRLVGREDTPGTSRKRRLNLGEEPDSARRLGEQSADVMGDTSVFQKSTIIMIININADAIANFAIC
jgi:hypothetical protein